MKTNKRYFADVMMKRGGYVLQINCIHEDDRAKAREYVKKINNLYKLFKEAPNGSEYKAYLDHRLFEITSKFEELCNTGYGYWRTGENDHNAYVFTVYHSWYHTNVKRSNRADIPMVSIDISCS